MLNIAIAAVTMAMTMMAPQTVTTTTQGESMMHSGPWQMRKSTGNEVNDRFWFVADRTLNAAEAETITSMFRNVPGGTEQIIKEAVLGAIAEGATGSTTSSSGMAMGVGPSDNGMTDLQILDALRHNLSWTEVGGLSIWMENATSAQLDAVAKLVRRGAWANSMWTGNSGS